MNGVSGRVRAAGSAAGPPGGPRLADKHALLLRQVTARAAKVQAAASRGEWPAAELASLARYVQSELLGQAAAEEAHLFAAGLSPATARLARDHVRLRAGTELLARAASGEQVLSPGQLAAAARDFVDQLVCHLSIEEKLLAKVPASTPD